MALVRIGLGSAAATGLNPWDLDEAELSRAPEIHDFAAEAARLRQGALALNQTGIEDLLAFFDAARGALAQSSGPGEPALPGIAYLYYFLSGTNLRRLLEAGLRGEPRHLDGFPPPGGPGKRLAAMPRGLVTHWLAGNVPALGLISLVQGILTKNANVLKLPRRNGLALPALFRKILEFRGGSSAGAIDAGAMARALEAAVLFVYSGPKDVSSHAALSMASDVRVAWGGAEAVEAVGRLPRKPGAEDVVFGPHFSLAVVGRERLSAGGLDELVDRLATDASVFDQCGCNSAQAVFVERGGKGVIEPRDFARALGAAMARALRRIPKAPADAAEAYAVAAVRSEMRAMGEVIASEGTEWTVVYSEEESEVRPCGSRVVFVRPVDDAMDTVDELTPEVQTVGLAMDEPRRTEWAAAAAARGVSRIVAPGSMSLYDYPWDGLFPVDRLVRWVSLD